jgi:hypothetical protein
MERLGQPAGLTFCGCGGACGFAEGGAGEDEGGEVEDAAAGGAAGVAGGDVSFVGLLDRLDQCAGVLDEVAAGLGAGSGFGSGLFADEGAAADEQVVAELLAALEQVDAAVFDAAAELGQVVPEPVQEAASPA